MKIALGADHAGVVLKHELAERLRAQGHEIHDLGTNSNESCDYPDFAGAVAREVGSGTADRGILICTTGIGMMMAANKVRGVRAALGTQPEAVQLTRQHNDANVLTVGAKFTSLGEAELLVDTFLNTEFSGGERHSRRVAKIKALEDTSEQEHPAQS